METLRPSGFFLRWILRGPHDDELLVQRTIDEDLVLSWQSLLSTDIDALLHNNLDWQLFRAARLNGCTVGLFSQTSAHATVGVMIHALEKIAWFVGLPLWEQQSLNAPSAWFP